jgi:hypothetical protein
MKKFWRIIKIILFGVATIFWGIDFYNLLNGIIPTNFTISIAILFTGLTMLLCTINEITTKID